MSDRTRREAAKMLRAAKMHEGPEQPRCSNADKMHRGRSSQDVRMQSKCTEVGAAKMPACRQDAQRLEQPRCTRGRRRQDARRSGAAKMHRGRSSQDAEVQTRCLKEQSSQDAQGPEQPRCTEAELAKSEERTRGKGHPASKEPRAEWEQFSIELHNRQRLVASRVSRRVHALRDGRRGKASLIHEPTWPPRSEERQR